MRLASVDHFGIDLRKLVVAGFVVGALSALALGLIVGGVLGQAAVGFDFTILALVFYIVVSTPRRVLDARRILQAREAVLLSALVSATLRVTGSRSRTLLMLKPREAELQATFREAGRLVLLGESVEEAAIKSGRMLVSYSASNMLLSAATLRPGAFSEGDEEVSGLSSAELLSRETKLPVFMTACFFSPIMLLLYAVFSHLSGPTSLAELVALEVVVLDIAYLFCSGQRGGDI
jgi:hypothetical protein